jgi:SAM-dependent methyltransferase
MPTPFLESKDHLIKLFGHFMTLIYGDPLMLDRWMWIRTRLPRTVDELRLLDVGCGSGSFTLGAAKLGYHSIGISWDERNQLVAENRAKILRLSNARFDICDVRELCKYPEDRFDVIINCENIEHIIDDFKLMKDMYNKLVPGGFILLTSPYYFFRAIFPGEDGPYSKVEDGWHVRRGYTKEMLVELCESTGLKVEEISFCSGYFSQRVYYVFCFLARAIGLYPAWLLTLPLRIMPPLLDPLVRNVTSYPDYSICLLAYKPRRPRC